MKVIHYGEPPIAQMLRTQISHNKHYRLSNCVLKEETQDGVLLCNAISGELVLLMYDEKKDLDLLPGRITSNLNDLAEHGFIVPLDYDEKKIIEQLRSILRKRLSGCFRNYVILPTTYCNARCFYCYENEIDHIHMTEKMADKLVDFIEEYHDGQLVMLNWFGGEPLIGRKIIDRICSDLKNRGIVFSSKMVSNGFLFDRELIREAVKNWKLSLVQITLDGTEEIYNRTKAYVNIDESAYRRVLRNTKDLLESGVHVNLRLNLDKHNKEDLLKLISELDREYENKELLSVYVSTLMENTGVAPLCHEEGEITELRKYAEKLNSVIIEKHMGRKRNMLPYLIINQCMADGEDQLLVYPNGIVGKCEHYLDRYSVGSLDEGVQSADTVAWWMEKNVLDECEKCPLLASCIKLKHCPVNDISCTEEDRKNKISSYKKSMRDIYSEWVKAENKNSEKRRDK